MDDFTNKHTNYILFFIGAYTPNRFFKRIDNNAAFPLKKLIFVGTFPRFG